MFREESPNWWLFSLPTDQNIRLYDTTHGQFKEFRNIVARDVGWSIIDTDFRFEMKCFFPFMYLHKNRIKFKITCNSTSLIYPALSWFLLFSKDLRVWTSVECLLLIYLFLLLALISNTSYILAGLTTVSWRIVWYQNTMIIKLPLDGTNHCYIMEKNQSLKLKFVVIKWWLWGTESKDKLNRYWLCPHVELFDVLQLPLLSAQSSSN